MPRDARARDDLALVRRVLRGDRAAVGELAARLQCVPRILRVRNTKAGAPLGADELEDVCQDVLLITWRKLAQYDGQAELPAWVYRICVLELQNAIRKHFRARGAPAGGPAPLRATSPRARACARTLIPGNSTTFTRGCDESGRTGHT